MYAVYLPRQNLPENMGQQIMYVAGIQSSYNHRLASMFQGFNGINNVRKIHSNIILDYETISLVKVAKSSIIPPITESYCC